MVFIRAQIQHIQNFAKRKMGIELPLYDARMVLYELMSDDKFINCLNAKLRDKIKDFQKSRGEKPLDRIYSTSEAAKMWGMSDSNLRNAINRYKKFDEFKEMGWVRKSGNTWIIMEAAMRSVYGDPIDPVDQDLEPNETN